jgi:hypothetical protein
MITVQNSKDPKKLDLEKTLQELRYLQKISEETKNFLLMIVKRKQDIGNHCSYKAMI